MTTKTTKPRRNYGSGGLTFDAKQNVWVGTIEAGWTERGTRRRIKVKSKSKQKALQKLRDKEREIAQNGIPAEGLRSTTTVKSWCEEWLKITVLDRSPNAFRSDSSAVKKWIIPIIGHIKLANVSPGHVRAVSAAALDEGLKSSSVRRTHSVLMTMLKDAVAEGGYTVPQAAYLVAGPSAGESDRADIPLDDALKILEQAAEDKHSSRWVSAMLQALRPSEALGLTWSAIDFENDEIDISWQLSALPYNKKYDRTSGFRVPTGHESRQLVDAVHLVRPKSAAGWRIIPMVPWMKAALLEWKAKQTVTKYDLVWPDADGNPMKQRDDREAWYALTAKAGVEKTLPDGTTRPYDLYEARHTAATLLRRAGVDDDTIILIMGHATILSTKAYLHSDRERTRAALMKVAKTLQLEN